MKLGFGLPVSGSWATPANMVHFAQRAEALGYDSLWTFQRLLNPVDAELAPAYHSVHDPLVALGYVAAVTERVRLGVAIVNLPFYAPIVLAKQLTTLDILSAGRLDVGVGLGWAPQEFAATNVPIERRGKRAEEYVACLQAIWAADPVEFEGEFYRVPRSGVLPKPVQRPHPPLLFGGGAERALQRVGRLGAGWISASRADLTRIDQDIAVIKKSAEEAGRDADALRFITRGVVRVGPAGAPDRTPLTGSYEEIKEDIGVLADRGVTEVFIDLNFNPRFGSTEVDPAVAAAEAEEILEALAPG
ncbi:MAG: TIGR03619 family F420-dependent LLM class oxidoreductase [Actinomycetota bacterium]|nr:TIGR03619 family F420-dependent LLM class oxidoreductase [Actinomycetota bacterium]